MHLKSGVKLALACVILAQWSHWFVHDSFCEFWPQCFSVQFFRYNSSCLILPASDREFNNTNILICYTFVPHEWHCMQCKSFGPEVTW